MTPQPIKSLPPGGRQGTHDGTSLARCGVWTHGNVGRCSLQPRSTHDRPFPCCV